MLKLQPKDMVFGTTASYGLDMDCAMAVQQLSILEFTCQIFVISVDTVLGGGARSSLLAVPSAHTHQGPRNLGI
jgi:hypothetical protein